jgi:xanthine dehydrogenase molybdopterin-binding subunit B
MGASRTLSILAALVVVGSLSACGGGDKTESAAQQAGDAAVAARQIPQGVKITHTETGEAVMTGSEMPPLKTYAAAKEECGYWHAWYVGKTYGPGLDPNLTPTYLNAVAQHFAVHRAAPGDLSSVRRGCRAGLHA